MNKSSINEIGRGVKNREKPLKILQLTSNGVKKSRLLDLYCEIYRTGRINWSNAGV